MGQFFFDTASVDYISDAWRKLWGYVDEKDVLGVTTNPSAFGKVNIKTMEEALDRTSALCRLITKIRDDGKGVVYVQPPYSKMTIHEMAMWVNMFQSASDGRTKIACKLPPYYKVLSSMNQIETEAFKTVKQNIDFNVTGLADCATAAMAATFKPRYISVIIGRMEEKGIDAKEQINFIRQFTDSKTEIITGAMRTVAGVKWACQYGTVPTIGTKVFDLIFDEVGAKNFNTLWDDHVYMTPTNTAPIVTKDMLDLSEAFFVQMDQLGNDLYVDFVKELGKKKTVEGPQAWKKGDSLSTPVRPTGSH